MTNTNKKRKISLKPLKIKLSIFNAIIGVTLFKPLKIKFSIFNAIIGVTVSKILIKKDIKYNLVFLMP